jgi:hypothetical protein
MNDLLIIIDNWYRKPDGSLVTGNLSKNIIYFIEHNPNIKTVVLASYSCSHELFSNTIWYQNRKATVDNYEEQVNDDYLSNLKYNMATWEGLLNYVNPDIFQIAMRDMRELLTYVESNNIKNIFMSGVAWEICVKDRPLGYVNIHRHLPKINLFVDINCILDQHAKVPDMTLFSQWNKISDTLYEYNDRCF